MAEKSEFPRKPSRPAPGAQADTAASANTLAALRAQATDCKACPLFAQATQVVFGAGRAHASVMLVGEQPGDAEDLAGYPFVGPAGKLLDRALAAAGVERAKVYVTNAVKHFKFEPRGKRRMHKKPSDAEIDACYRWLEREIALVRPRLIVALGASAARALLGRATPVHSNRGALRPFADGAQLLITVHPSFLLRMPDEDKAAEFERFVADLRLAAPHVGE